MSRGDLIELRGGTAAQWTTANPVLAAREPGLETDTGKVKYGDGTTAWADLGYASGGGGVAVGASYYLEKDNAAQAISAASTAVTFDTDYPDAPYTAFPGTDWNDGDLTALPSGVYVADFEVDWAVPSSDRLVYVALVAASAAVPNGYAVATGWFPVPADATALWTSGGGVLIVPEGPTSLALRVRQKTADGGAGDDMSITYAYLNLSKIG